MIASPAPNLASFDDSGSDDPAMAALINRVQRSITARQSYAVRVLSEVSHPLPQDQRPDLMVVNIARVAPGREQDYMDIMTADFLPHFDEEKIHYVTGSLTFGGEGGFIHVFYVKDFAELDKGSPVMRALGAEGAQAVMKKFSGIVTSTELWIARLIPDVSYGPKAEESEKP